MPEVTLMQMLEARESRVWEQQRLLEKYQKPLLCFTMNIPGPVKDSPLIRRGFAFGRDALRTRLPKSRVLYDAAITAVTGCEAMYVVDMDALALKRLCVAIEDDTPLGRLFDMDVLDSDGRKLDRELAGGGSRDCIVCGAPGRGCASRRSHSVPQLQQAANAILSDHFAREDARRIGALAVQSLLDEVCTTPKPGLVDRRNSGSHRDMDFFTFQASAAALWPYFARCAEIGMDTRQESPEETFSCLRFPGKLAEGTMLRATGGVNTHKGAIFSMGILCGALGRLEREQWCSPDAVLAECAAMTKGIISRDYADLTPGTAKTAGQKLYLQYGITGVRGQAEAGFPAVLNVGLPKLEAALAAGKSINEAGCAALLAMLADTVDTNMIHRGGYELAKKTAEEIGALLEKEPFPSEKMLESLDQAFMEKNQSPGGTADLLALVYMLHFLKEEPHE